MAWFLINSADLRHVGSRPVDPGYGVPGRPGYGGGYPTPGPVFPERPVDPGYGRPEWGGPVDPGYDRPTWGGRPDNSLPGSGAHPWLPGHLGGPRPDQGLPRPPMLIPGLPHPEHPIAPPDASTKPPEPPTSGYIVVWVPGYGNVTVEIPLEQPPETAEPK